MSDPVARAARPALASPTVLRADLERTSASSAARQPSTGRFADALRAAREAPPTAPTPSVGETALRASVRSIVRGERLVSGVIDAARHGATFSNEQLIAIQAGVYRYTQELELAGKLVDKATSAVRQTLQSQQ
jgi:hypothetical protein